MNTINELIEALGGNSAVAAHLGKRFPSTVSEMKRRGSVRVEYWPGLIELASQRKVAGVTADALMRLHVDGSRDPKSLPAHRFERCAK